MGRFLRALETSEQELSMDTITCVCVLVLQGLGGREFEADMLAYICNTDMYVYICNKRFFLSVELASDTMQMLSALTDLVQRRHFHAMQYMYPIGVPPL